MPASSPRSNRRRANKFPPPREAVGREEFCPRDELIFTSPLGEVAAKTDREGGALFRALSKLPPSLTLLLKGGGETNVDALKHRRANGTGPMTSSATPFCERL